MPGRRRLHAARSSVLGRRARSRCSTTGSAGRCGRATPRAHDREHVEENGRIAGRRPEPRSASRAEQRGGAISSGRSARATTSPRSASWRRSTTPPAPRRSASRGADHADDPLRLARASATRSAPTRSATMLRGRGEVRHPARRPPALLRADRQPRGPRVPGGDGGGGELRVREPAGHGALGAGGLRPDASARR